MIDVIDPTLAAQNDGGAMSMINELAMSVTGDSGGKTLDAALREVAAGRGGEAALEALAGSTSHGALAVLDLLIDKLAIGSAAAELAQPACGCWSKDGAGAIDSGGDGMDLTMMSFVYSDGGDDGEPNDDVDGDGQPDDDIVVTGTRPKDMDGDGGDTGWNPNPGDDIGGGSEGGVGGGDLPGEETPCVDEIPTGADLAEVNDLAKAAAAKLAALQDSTGWEWGAIVYRGSDGMLHVSREFTAQHPDSITRASVSLPDGAHIVAMIRTHPIDSMDQRLLSDTDRQFIDDLLDGIGSITADENMLSYIVKGRCGGSLFR